ncbi:MAG: FGGY-family carbohydrate kinase [Bacteroidales bacterium]|nr:FGGY-family carbohydrate kinase [Bacteroidales bacterium]
MKRFSKYILTIDLGTSGPKVVLFDTQANVIDDDFAPTGYDLLPNGGAEQIPNDWWKAIKKAILNVLARNPDARKNIEAISVTTQWSGTVAVDKNGKALMNAIIWMDARGAGQVKEITKGIIELEGYGVSKLWHWLRRTGGIPTRAGKDPIAHILFIKENMPDIYKKTYKFLEPKDYINLLLSGEFVSTYDTMVLHWVTDNRDINNIRYSKKLLSLSGIEREKLPDMVYAHEEIGTLRKEIADELGLNNDVKIIAGTPDVNSAAIGSGAIKQKHAHIYIGTSSWLASFVPYKKTDIFHNIASLPSALKGKYLITNEQETAGECINFLRDNVFFHQDILNTPAPENYYEKINQLAEETPVGSNKLIFTPWLYGERSPAEDNFVRGGFHNLALQHTRREMIRAVFEGVAFNNRWLLKYVEKLAGNQFEYISFIGGGALSGLWSQILADVLQREIRQMEQPILANARGAAVLALIGLGYLDVEDSSQTAKAKKIYQPKTENTKIYDELFKEYLNIYHKNKKIYRRLNRTAVL